MDISQLSNADLLGALQQSQAPSLSGMSDADLLKAIGKQPAPQQDVSTLGDIAKSGGVGLAEGAIGLAGLPGDLANLASKGYDYLTGSDTNASVAPYANAIGSQAIQKGIEKYTGPFYQPKTTAGDYARTIGEFAPAAIGGPETLATKVATRVVAPAVASETAGQLTKGTSLEPYARVAGALGGAIAPSAISRVVSPSTISATNADAVNTLKNAGVQLTAGQQSGSRVLKYMESELGDALGAGNKATQATERAHEQFTTAALNRAGIDAPRATPEVMDNAFNANSDLFNSIAANNPSIPIPGFKQQAQNVIDEFKSATNTDAPALKAFVDRITNSSQLSFPADKQNLVNAMRAQGVSDKDIAKTLGVAATPTPAGAISGESYQTIQSQIAKAARLATDPTLKLSLYDLRAALDKSVQDGLKTIGKTDDANAWMQARQQYKNLLVLERAMSKTTETAANGLITPAALQQAETAVAGRRNVVRGKGTFSDLARAGNAVMKPLPQSGTAPRAAAHIVPSIVGGVVGAGLSHIPGVALGLASPALLGRAIMSRPGQAYLSNQLATSLRQIPLRRSLLTSGLLALPSSQVNQLR